MHTTTPTYHTFQLSSGVSVRYATKGTDLDLIFFLGLGQSGHNLRKIIEAMPVGSVAIEAFPYHALPIDGMESICSQGVVRLLTFLQVSMETTDIIAESQAAPTVIAGLIRISQLPHSLTLLEPLGFNKQFLGNTPDERYRSLMQRSRKFWSHPNQSLTLRANRSTIWEISKRTIPAWHRVKADYTFGANQDAIDSALKLAEKILVCIHADEQDSLFPYDEISQGIKGSSVEMVKSHAGSHLNRASAKGLSELQLVVTLLRGSNR